MDDDTEKRAAIAELELERLRLENQRLRAENEQLTREFHSGRSDNSQQPLTAELRREPQAVAPTEQRPAEPISNRSAPSEKISLFRSLFRGRDDVYAYRWENRSGKSGYSPSYVNSDPFATDNAVKSDSDNGARRCDPLTASVIRDHLVGKRTIGIFPLVDGDRCWFLAIDFDKKAWQRDVGEFLRTCRRYSVPAIIERSRSGQGAHVWIFFEEAIDAAVARKLGSRILTLTMQSRYELGLDSYDRLFPNQDTLPKGGYGNLIALPLQGESRKSGNSVFVDDGFSEYADQWLCLATVQKFSADVLQSVLRTTASFGDETGIRVWSDVGDAAAPWTWRPSRQLSEGPIPRPLPKVVKIVRSDQLYIEKSGLPSGLLDRFIRFAAFQNPEFYKAQAMRFSTFDKPRIIACAEEFQDHIGLPRGCIDNVLGLCKEFGIEPIIEDLRLDGQPIETSFQGVLRSDQMRAAAALLEYENGVFSAPTAFGKTVIAAWIIAQRNVSTLILVHRRQLADQWRERLGSFLSLSARDIGTVGGGRNRRTGKIDIAILQSAGRKGAVKDWVAEYGQIIVDECHHVSAFSFEAVLRRAKARYVLGLTATPTRKDGHEPIVYMQCGPIRFNAGNQVAELAMVRQSVVPVATTFSHIPMGQRVTIQDLYGAMAIDEIRNNLIVEIVRKEVTRGRRPLVLTARTSHVDLLASLLRGRVDHVFVMKGGMGRRQEKAVTTGVALVDEGRSWAIVATGSYIGEGYDEERLDTLILAMPISWRGTLQQYVGRLHRVHVNKHEVIVYDLVDEKEPVLLRMYRRRIPGYRAVGYEVGAIVSSELVRSASD